jgi:hypothetical protein
MRQRARTIADEIYFQMKEHFVCSDSEQIIYSVKYSSGVQSIYLRTNPKMPKVSYIANIPDNDVEFTIFEGFRKSIYPL